MIQPASGDARIPKLKSIATGHFCELAACGHRTQIHREVWVRHLRLENALQAVVAQEFGPKTVEVKLISRRIEGRKKRNALDYDPNDSASRICAPRGPRLPHRRPIAFPVCAARCRSLGSMESRPAWSVRGMVYSRRNAKSRDPPSASNPGRPRSSVSLPFLASSEQASRRVSLLELAVSNVCGRESLRENTSNGRQQLPVKSNAIRREGA